MLTASSSGNGGSKQLPPEGNHPARCVSVIDLGTQCDTYNGEPKALRKVRITFELPQEKAVFKKERGEEPFVIGKDYTLSLGERANLRRDLESWRGKGFTEAEAKAFHLSRLLGAPAMVSVVHRVSKNNRTYADIATVTRVPKGMKVPEQILPSLKYDIENGADAVFEQLPKFLQDKIKAADEWRSQSAHGESNGHDEPTLHERLESELDEQ
jgi:hypothetical protein